MRVVLADDAVLVRQGIALLLRDAGIDVVAECGDVATLVAAVEEHRPDVAIVDIRMPPTFSDDGIRAAEEIRRRHRHVGVLVLSQYVDVRFAVRLLSGEDTSVGYLLKDRVTDVGGFIEAISRVAAGGVVVEPTLAAAVPTARSAPSLQPVLSAREQAVLSLIAEGHTDRGIADRLLLSPKTVEKAVSSVFGKLGLPTSPLVNKRVHAVLRYLADSSVRLGEAED